MAELPESEEGLRQWVEDAWIRKDLFLERWYDQLTSAEVDIKPTTP
jgi:hypothetical protein